MPTPAMLIFSLGPAGPSREDMAGTIVNAATPAAAPSDYVE